MPYKDPEKARQNSCERTARYVAKNRDLQLKRVRNSALKRHYGITIEEYETMLVAQNGVCAVCRRPNADRMGRRLHVDHDHETGRIRSLLCTNCNLAIGHSSEDPLRLRALAEYLERHK